MVRAIRQRALRGEMDVLDARCALLLFRGADPIGRLAADMEPGKREAVRFITGLTVEALSDPATLAAVERIAAKKDAPDA